MCIRDRLLTLFPAIPFADPKLVETGLKATAGLASAGEASVALSSTTLEDVSRTLKGSGSEGADLVRTACGCGGEEETSHDDQSFMVKNWKLLTTSLCLAITSLQECQLANRTPLVCTHCRLYLHIRTSLCCKLDCGLEGRGFPYRVVEWC